MSRIVDARVAGQVPDFGTVCLDARCYEVGEEVMSSDLALFCNNGLLEAENTRI
jgi:hypothetical protein